MDAVYSGIDLHSTNSVVAVIDSTGQLLYRRPNELSAIAAVLAPYREALQGVVVESTFNWYWLVDGLMAAGYRVRLANPTAIRVYSVEIGTIARFASVGQFDGWIDGAGRSVDIVADVLYRQEDRWGTWLPSRADRRETENGIGNRNVSCESAHCRRGCRHDPRRRFRRPGQCGRRAPGAVGSDSTAGSQWRHPTPNDDLAAAAWRIRPDHFLCRRTQCHSVALDLRQRRRS